MKEVERSECSVASTEIELAPSCQSYGPGERFRRESSLRRGSLPAWETGEVVPGCGRRGIKGETDGNTPEIGEAGTLAGGAGNLKIHR